MYKYMHMYILLRFPIRASEERAYLLYVYVACMRRALHHPVTPVHPLPHCDKLSKARSINKKNCSVDMRA